jgi:CDP-diglyceride synthetase
LGERGGDVDENEDQPSEDLPVVETPPTERVRIIGAEPAVVAAGLAEPEDFGATDSRTGPVHGVDVTAEETADEPVVTHPELPHWTDPPTGQAPVVLRVGEDLDEVEDEAWSALRDAGPAWREHHHEWEEVPFEPSQLADEETRVGVLDQAPVEERRPWEFGEPEGDEDSPDVVEERTEALIRGDEDLSAEDRDGREREPDSSLVEPTGPDEHRGEISETDRRGDLLDRAGARRSASSSETVSGNTSGGFSSRLSAWGRGHGRTPVSAPGSPRPTRSPESDQAGPSAVPVSRTASRKAGRSLPIAILSGVVFAGVALLAFKLGTVESLVLSTVVVFLAAVECFATLRRARRRPATFLGLVATVALMVAAYTRGVGAIPLVLALVVVASLVWYLVDAHHKGAVTGVASTLLGFCWVGLLGSYAALLLAPSQFPNRHGIAFLLGAVIATVGHDVGGITVGTFLGRHPLSKTISPNKTWEGLFGGMLGAIALSVLLVSPIAPWDFSRALALGVVVAVVAPLGDLSESLIKRDLGVKDMGSLLPGHGGVLDRVDGLLFVLPATYYLVRVLNLG